MSVRHTYDLDDLDCWYDWYDRLDSPGPYHNPKYIECLTGNLEDERTAELFVFEAEDGSFVYYPYLVRYLEELPFSTQIDSPLCDIVSSWYYGGPLRSETADSSVTREFTAEFGEYCRKNQIVSEFVRFDPNCRNDRDFEILEPQFNRETVWVDLTLSQSGLWDQFEKRNRNAIRQAQESGIVVEPTTQTEDLAAFYEIYANAMDAKGASEHYRFSESFFEGLLDTELSTLLVSRYDDDVIGGSVIVHDETIAHDYLRASNPEYWDMRVNNLLCYGALMHMRETGRETFDFQGGRPGVFNFKKGFSTENRGEFHIAKRIHAEQAYKKLVEDASDAGIDVSKDYFPRYRNEKSN